MMTVAEAKSRYEYLALIRKELRQIDEHGLANYVNDRMCHLANIIPAGDMKETALALADEGIVL